MRVNDTRLGLPTNWATGGKQFIAKVVGDCPVVQGVFEDMSKSTVADFGLDVDAYASIDEIFDDAIPVNIVRNARELFVNYLGKVKWDPFPAVRTVP